MFLMDFFFGKSLELLHTVYHGPLVWNVHIQFIQWSTFNILLHWFKSMFHVLMLEDSFAAELLRGFFQTELKFLPDF